MSENMEVANLNVKLTLDDTGVNKSMAELNREMKVVQSEFQKASAQLGDFGKGSDGLRLKADSLTKQIEVQQQRVAKLREEHSKAAQEKGEDARQTQNLETRLNKAEAELAKMEHQLKDTNEQLRIQSSSWTQWSQSLDAAGQKMKAVGQQMQQVGRTMTAAITVPLTAIAGLSIKTFTDFESAFAGVRKTVDASEAEFAMLEKGIRSMAKEIPAAATEIARVGEAAGQLGIQNDAILGFTRTMIDMGVATNMSSDEAAMALARLATITQMNQQEFDRLGSTVVHLGNNFAAMESEIVDMSLRIAGAGNTIGMTEAQILGFSAALASVGIRAEMGGSAISRVMIDIANAVAIGGEAVQGFAQVAGMSVSDFQRAFEEDAAMAIIAFIEGLNGIRQAGGNVFQVLEDLSLSEIRVRDTLLRAAGAGDTLRHSIELGTQAWQENNALTNEAEERYKTTASQLQIFKNRLTDIGITLGGALVPALLKLLDSLQPLIDRIAKAAEWFANLSDGSRTFVIVVGAIVAAIGPLLMALGSMSVGLAGVLAVVSKASAAIAAAGGAVAAMGKLFTAALAPVKAFGSALTFLAMTPIGRVISAIGVLIGLISSLVKWFKKDSIPAVQSFGEQAEVSASRASGSFQRFRNSAKESLDGATEDAKVAGAAIGSNVEEGVSKGTGKAKDKAVADMKEMFDKMKAEVDRNTESLNRLGDAISNALKKQYEEMEKVQTTALEKQIEAEKKASDERLKIYDHEYTEKLKLIDEETYRQVKALQDQIDAIDDQTSAEEKAQREQEHQARLAELQKQLAAAETAEERERIQQDLNRTIASYERQQLLEQRKIQKDGLKEQIEAVKEEAKQKKEQLKQELEDRKESEKEKLAVIQQGLNDEKAAVKAHFEELKKEENVRAEARLMMVEENNDDIIKLLESYNPKWQDAGQSFADSFKNGLNSDNQSIADAVQEAIDIVPVIEEQVKALDELEVKLKEVEEKIKGSGAGSGGGGLGGLSLDLENVSESADDLTDSLEDLLVPMGQVSDAAQTMGEDSLAAFIGLRDNATLQLNQLYWSGAKITEDMATEIADTFVAMGNEINGNMDEAHAEQLQSLQELFNSTNSLTEEQKEQMLKQLQEKQEQERNEIESGQQRIFEILSTALDDQRTLTKKEYDEINAIQKTFTETAESVFRAYETDQKALYERLKADASQLSAQQAAEVVKNSLEQKDKTIEAAEDQYESVLKEVIRQRDEVGSISEEQAEKLILEAKRQKDEAVKAAEQMHENVVSEAKKQAEEHAKFVNWETGEILTNWGVFVNKLGDKWTEMKDRFKRNMETIRQQNEEDWNKIKDFLSGINLEDIGSNIVKGLAKGITAAGSFVWSAVKGIAGGITGTLSEELEVRSPSRVMIRMGGDIGKGLELGLRDSIIGIQRQAYAMSEAAIPVMNEVSVPMNARAPAGATEATGGSQTINLARMFEGAVFHVRSDEDIQKIAREIFALQQNAVRGGVV